MSQQQPPIPVEVVAAITAAVAAVIDQPVGNFAIRSIEPVQAAQVGRPQAIPSAWAKAGLIQSHLARAAFGNRNR